MWTLIQYTVHKKELLSFFLSCFQSQWHVAWSCPHSLSTISLTLVLELLGEMSVPKANAPGR